MGTITVLNEQGDTRIEWDPKDAESVKKAKQEWATLKEAGFEFFAVDETKGKRVKAFNAKLGKVIAAPGVKSHADKSTGTREKAMAGGPNSSVVERIG